MTPDLVKSSFESNKLHLRFRSFSMRALAAAVYLSEDIHPARSKKKPQQQPPKTPKVENGGGGGSGAEATTTTEEDSKADRMLLVLRELIQDIEQTRRDCGAEDERVAAASNSSHEELACLQPVQVKNLL